MAKQPSLSPGAIREIETAVSDLFDRIKVRALGPRAVDKQLVVGWKPELSLPGLFMAASGEEGARPDEDVMGALVKIASGYLDAEKERTKAQVVKAVGDFLKEAKSGKVKTNVQTVLGGKLADVMARVTSEVDRIIDTEATTARNVGVLDGISKVNSASGIEDPVVYFVVVRDNALCGECKRLHLLEDEITPRVWKMSSVSHGYHKRGEDSPSIGGEHPHCRCSLVSLMPGYGFTDAGMITYIGPDHDEFERQRD